MNDTPPAVTAPPRLDGVRSATVTDAIRKPRARRFGRVALITAALAGAVAVGTAVTSGTGRVVQAVGTPGAGGEYHPLTPTRILDTRDPLLDVAEGDGPVGRKPMATKDGTSTFDVQVAGVGGLPGFLEAADGTDANVLAVAVNITVVTPTQQGYLRAFGKGAAEGETSVVNFDANTVVPNAAILRPGLDGKLTIRLVAPAGTGDADVLIDLFGWFSSSNVLESGSRVVPVGPGRVYDSREAPFGAAPIAGDAQVAIPVRGADSVNPDTTDLVPDNAAIDGVLVNLTAVNSLPGSQPTHISILPDAPAAGERPTTSNLNLIAGQTRSVMAIVPVGADGAIHLFNRAGSTHLIVDIVGYLQPAADPTSNAGRVVPLVAPYRALDTRTPEHGATPLGPAMSETWSFDDFIADVRIGEEWVGAQLGLLGNLTATELGRQYPTQYTTSFLTAYPPTADGVPPHVSNIFISEAQTLPNLALLKYGPKADDERCQDATCVSFFNRGGYLHYLLDVSAVILADTPS